MGAPQFMPSSYRAYAVDSSNDGRRDIWADWQDVIGSIANYLVRHGWQPGTPVVAQETLGDGFSGVADPARNSLSATETVASLSREGVMLATDLAGDEPGPLPVPEGDKGNEYWVGFHNFFVITRYNRSVMYAMVVHQLGREIALKVERGASSSRGTRDRPVCAGGACRLRHAARVAAAAVLSRAGAGRARGR